MSSLVKGMLMSMSREVDSRYLSRRDRIRLSTGHMHVEDNCIIDLIIMIDDDSNDLFIC